MSVYDQKRVIVGDMDFIATDIEIAFSGGVPSGVTRVIARVPRGCEEGWRLAVNSLPVVEWPQHVVIVSADGSEAKVAIYADDTPDKFAERVDLAMTGAVHAGTRWCSPRVYVESRDRNMVGRPVWEVKP